MCIAYIFRWKLNASISSKIDPFLVPIVPDNGNLLSGTLSLGHTILDVTKREERVRSIGQHILNIESRSPLKRFDHPIKFEAQ